MHDVTAMRAAARERARARPPGPELPLVTDIAAGPDVGVAMRLYRPSVDPRPLAVYLHGGGWVIGDLETHDRTCRRLAAAADVSVLAVDVRNAPEHPWPAAVDDAVGALGWAARNRAGLGCEGHALGVAGDSSGGLVAALACLRLRATADPPPAAQLLAYPNTDLTLSQPSVAAKGEGWGLDARDLRWFAAQWVPDAGMRRSPLVSPLHATDLAGLPAALIVTAEHDPLRDEGDAFARRLRQAGVPVEHRCEPGLAHGFLQGADVSSPAVAAASARFFSSAGGLLRAVGPGSGSARG